MTRLTRLCRAVGVGLAVATATLSMTQVADAAPAPPTVPPNLCRPPEQVFLVGHAKGVQIYTCDGDGLGTVRPPGRPGRRRRKAHREALRRAHVDGHGRRQRRQRRTVPPERAQPRSWPRDSLAASAPPSRTGVHLSAAC